MPISKLKQSVLRAGLDDKETKKLSDALFIAQAQISENIKKRYGGLEKALIIALVSGILALLSLMMLFSWPPAHLEKPNQKSGI